jgi:hypothetical protein
LGDRAVVTGAFKQTGIALQFAAEELKSANSALLMHPSFVLLLSYISAFLKYAPPPIRKTVSLLQVIIAQGLVMLMLYISIFIIVVPPHQCEKNPDEMRSIDQYRAVICEGSSQVPAGHPGHNSEHNLMIVFSAFGILIYDVINAQSMVMLMLYISISIIAVLPHLCEMNQMGRAPSISTGRSSAEVAVRSLLGILAITPAQ